MHNHPYDSHDHFVQVLDEMTLNDIIPELTSNNLPHKDYSALIKMSRYMGYKGNILKFFVPNKYNGWNCMIRYVEWEEQMRDTSITAVEAARLLIWGANLQVHCTCPAYHFWGMQYIDTQLDMAIYPEDRFPSIRNSQLRGIVCKHLKRTLFVTKFHSGTIAAAIKEQRRQLGIEYVKPN
jgi:hypothetical protein